MKTFPLNVDPVVLAAQAGRAFCSAHRLAYAHISPDLVIRQVSLNFMTLLGSDQDPLGQPLAKALWMFSSLEETLREVLAGSLPIYTLEYVHYGESEKSESYLNFQIRPIDEQNPDHGLLLLVADATEPGKLRQGVVQERNELRLTQEKLARTNEKLRLIDRQKSLFLSIAAHDLRGPLSAIHGLASLLPAKLKQEQVAEFGASILSQSNRMNEMITDLLELDRIEQKSLELDITECVLNEIMEDVVRTLTTEIGKRSLVFTLDLPPNPILMKGDRVKLWRVFYNLISNAIKYTAKDGEVSVSIEEKEGEAVVVVADNGYGMTKDQTAQLFDLYYRTDDARQSGKVGAGLGLFIVKNLVEAHNGRVSVTSEVGEGTTFTLNLPVTTPLSD